jgi:hypothetical protein
MPTVYTNLYKGRVIEPEHIACWDAMAELFFASPTPIGRRLPQVISETSQKPVTGPWRYWGESADNRPKASYMPLSQNVIAAHLSGNLCHGLQPAMLLCYAVGLDGSVFTAIDLDVVGATHSNAPAHFESQNEAYQSAMCIISKAKHLGLTPHLELTKSAGYRVWIFHHRVDAATASNLGHILVKRAGLHKNTEVFPKQSALLSDQVGSAVFVPYNGQFAAIGRQVMIDPQTQEIRLVEEFCANALQYRSDVALCARIVEAASDAGDLESIAVPTKRIAYQGEGLISKFVGSEAEIWKAHRDGCMLIQKIVSECEAGQTDYNSWFQLATHLKSYSDWGAEEFHRLSSFDVRYDVYQTDDLWDGISGGPVGCIKMQCGLNPQTDCELPEGKNNAISHAYAYLQQLPQLKEPIVRTRSRFVVEAPSSLNVPSTVGERPALNISGCDLDALMKQSLAHLAASNIPPTLFSTGGRLHLIQDSCGSPKLVPLSLDRLRVEFARRILVQTTRETKDGLKVSGTFPPDKLLQGILALNEWPGIPECDVVTDVPLMAPSGMIQSEVGYCAATRAYLANSNFIFKGRPEATSQQEAKAALNWFFDLPLSGFPFENEASRVHAICAMLQGFVMPVINAPTPLYLLDALLRSSGKTMLADMLIRVSCSTPVMMSMPDNEQERQKTLVSTLMTRPSHVLFDNVSGELKSPSLESVLTSRTWSARVLGSSNNVAIPVTSTFLLTANQAKLSTDLASRSVYIRLTPNMESPEMRDDFKIKNMDAWMTENRAACIDKALTILAYWAAQGMPLYQGKQRHRQGRWTAVMGGIMESIGIGDNFLANNAALTQNADDETTRWKAFTNVWWDTFGEKAVGTKELMPLAYGPSDVFGRITEAEGVWADMMFAESAVRLKASLGKKLSSHKDRVFDNRKIGLIKDVKHGNKYTLKPLVSQTAEPIGADMPVGHSPISVGFSKTNGNRGLAAEVHARTNEELGAELAEAFTLSV